MSIAEPSSTASRRGVDGAVAVPSGVEAALAAVEQKLVEQAPALRLVRTPASATPVTLIAAPAPAPAPLPPPPPPRPRRRPIRPVPSTRLGLDELAAMELGDDELDDLAPRRPVERRIDLDDLTADERAALGRLQARKVGRVVRDVSPWSVFKFSLLFYVCVWLIVMVAGVILWRVGQGAGVVANIEKFYAKASGEQTFELDGRGMFRAAATMGVVLVVALTGLSVMLAMLFNLVTDLTGGIRLSVVELESARRPVRLGSAGQSVLRRAQADVATASSIGADESNDESNDDLDDVLFGDEPDDDLSIASAPIRSAAAPAVPTLVPDQPRLDREERANDDAGDADEVRSAAR